MGNRAQKVRRKAVYQIPDSVATTYRQNAIAGAIFYTAALIRSRESKSGKQLSKNSDTYMLFRKIFLYCPAQLRIMNLVKSHIVEGFIMENTNRLRLLFIQNILSEKTNEEHPITIAQIIALLESRYGIVAHRTTVSDDLQVLQEAGMDIVKVRSTQSKYFLAGRQFEVPEIKILLDAVLSSKMLTENKSIALSEKLLSLTDCHTAAALRQGLRSIEGDKPANEKIYYIIDAITRAILRRKKISFHYFRYNEQKERVLRHEGESYVFSPYTLVWNGDYYYLVGISARHEGVSTFRVDRIAECPVILEEEAAAMPAGFDISRYLQQTFRMFDAKHRTVRLLCANDTMDALIDRFGEDITAEAYDKNTFIATVDIAVSHIFYNWIFGFCGKIRILSPQDVQETYKQMLRDALDGAN